MNTGVAFGSGNACNGNKGNDAPAVVIDLAATPSPNILIGVEVAIVTNDLVAGTYTSNTGGGTPITLTVVFQ